jgi:hypothetical protein
VQVTRGKALVESVRVHWSFSTEHVSQNEIWSGIPIVRTTFFIQHSVQESVESIITNSQYTVNSPR